jgi:hypothetical protein
MEMYGYGYDPWIFESASHESQTYVFVLKNHMQLSNLTMNCSRTAGFAGSIRDPKVDSQARDLSHYKPLLLISYYLNQKILPWGAN